MICSILNLSIDDFNNSSTCRGPHYTNAKYVAKYFFFKAYACCKKNLLINNVFTQNCFPPVHLSVFQCSFNRLTNGCLY
jgi:hypothetical protein